MTWTWEQTADGEEGDETDWDSVAENGSSTLDVSTASKKNGSYGWEVTLVDNTAYGELSDPSSDTELTVEFQFDPNSITMAANDRFVLMQADDSGWTGVELRYTGSVYQVRISSRLDAATYTTSSWYEIEDAYQKIQVGWKAATAAGKNNGFASLYIEDLLKEFVGGLDNDTGSIDEVRFGCISGYDAGTTGAFYMDDCRWMDEVYWEPLELFARFRDYNLTAPQKFTISSSKVQMTARYRDYNFTAPKKEGYG